MTKPIQFIDIQAQQEFLGDAPLNAIKRVLAHGQYIMGKEVGEFEEELADFCGVKHVISCSSGTDALLLLLMAKGLKAGEMVLLPSFTFPATAEVVCLLGGLPYFVDVDPLTMNIHPHALEEALMHARAKGFHVSGAIAVDLFGQPADYDCLEVLCEKYGIWLLADAAQSLGAKLGGRRVGQMGEGTACSFFPAKPLGCYGDGGAVLTNDPLLAEKIQRLRVHGKGTHKYDIVDIGLNARMDTLQAAILLEKLKIFPEEIIKREKVAAFYDALFEKKVSAQKIIEGASSVYAMYTLKVRPEFRPEIIETLSQHGIPTGVYYPKPMHQQEAYQKTPLPFRPQPNSESLANSVLSLPMHPYLTPEEQTAIADQLISAIDTLALTPALP